jgi:hypothetical protein
MERRKFVNRRPDKIAEAVTPRNLPHAASTHHAEELAEKKKRNATLREQASEREASAARHACHAEPRLPLPLSDARSGRNRTDKFEDTFCALRLHRILPPANRNKVEQPRKNTFQLQLHLWM